MPEKACADKTLEGILNVSLASEVVKSRATGAGNKKDTPSSVFKMLQARHSEGSE